MQKPPIVLPVELGVSVEDLFRPVDRAAVPELADLLDFLAERMQGVITEKATITPSEVRQFFGDIPKDSLPYFNAEVEIREIVYKPAVSAAERTKAQERAQDLRKRIEFARITSRVAPLLGLVATMIPMGPALKGLSDGNLGDVSRGLMIGCPSGEFVIGPANTNGALSPSNFQAFRRGDRGSSPDVAGVRVGAAVLFVSRSGRKVHEFVYDFSTDGFTSSDQTVLSEHITGQGVVQMAHQEEPEGVLWLVREDGALLSLTYDREQEVRAWCRHGIGGQDARVESVAVVPNPYGTADDVYVAVARTICCLASAPVASSKQKRAVSPYGASASTRVRLSSKQRSTGWVMRYQGDSPSSAVRHVATSWSTAAA